MDPNRDPFKVARIPHLPSLATASWADPTEPHPQIMVSVYISIDRFIGFRLYDTLRKWPYGRLRNYCNSASMCQQHVNPNYVSANTGGMQYDAVTTQ